MDASYIKPFVASIQNVFATMMQLPVSLGTPHLKTKPGASSDVTGIIGLSGDVIGTVALAFSEATASRVVALFGGQQLATDNPDFADAIGELVNMVCGGAKAMFTNKRVSISCPSVVLGAGHLVATPQDTPCVVIPCTSDCGDFAIEVAIREAAVPTKPVAAAAAQA